MCLTTPGLVTAVGDGTALVRIDDMTRTALTLLTPDVQVGDWVLVGAGAILRHVGRAEAEEIRRVIASASSPGPSTHDQTGGPP